MLQGSLFWIDLEMTGLNLAQDAIIEVASVVTNDTLDVIAEGPSLVIHQPEFVLEKMDAWNKNQHSSSGLLDRVRSSHITLAEAYELTLDFARRCCKKNVPVCGNSVYQDRAFLKRFMPELDQYFNYRIIDVTTIKEVVRRWYTGDPNALFEKKSNHRALEDVYASIEELKHYRAYFFKPIVKSSMG